VQPKTKAYAVVVTAFVASMLALIPLAAGAGAITLVPTAQAPGASVTVSGTGFGATINVAVVFGGEIQVVSESFMPIINGPDSRDYNFTHGPIKPGSFHIRRVTLDTGNPSAFSDDGKGNIFSDNSGSFFGTMNYALGGFIHTSTLDPTAYEWAASYTYYQYIVTSFGRVNTTASGTFSANFTVPAVANGNYNVTAIDSGGSLATTNLNVSSTIPEVLPLGGVLLLSSVAVVAGSWYFRKRPRSTE
jgi:hypothetical protein